MPSSNESGRSWFRRALSEGVDRLFLNNRAHDYQSGYWNKQGAIEGGISGLLDTLAPGAGFIAGTVFDARNRGPEGSSTYAPYIEGLTKGGAGDWKDVGYATLPTYGKQPNVTVGQPQPVSNPGGGFLGGFTGTQPTAPTDSGPWQGLGTSTGNVFNGGSLGSWSNTVTVKPPSAAELAMGGASQGGGHGSQWTGISGDAARGLFAGMRNASNDAAKEELAAAMRRMKQ